MDIVLQLNYDEAALIEYLLWCYQENRPPVKGVEREVIVGDTLKKVERKLDDFDEIGEE